MYDLKNKNKKSILILGDFTAWQGDETYVLRQREAYLRLDRTKSERESEMKR